MPQRYLRAENPSPENTETVTNVLGQLKTYVINNVDAQGKYTTVPDYDKMPTVANTANVSVHCPLRNINLT